LQAVSELPIAWQYIHQIYAKSSMGPAFPLNPAKKGNLIKQKKKINK